MHLIQKKGVSQNRCQSRIAYINYTYFTLFTSLTIDISISGSFLVSAAAEHKGSHHCRHFSSHIAVGHFEKI